MENKCNCGQESCLAFQKAIKEGRLSKDRASPNYAGHYMFMGQSPEGKDLFKHIDTRRYIK